MHYLLHFHFHNRSELSFNSSAVYNISYDMSICISEGFFNSVDKYSANFRSDSTWS